MPGEGALHLGMGGSRQHVGLDVLHHPPDLGQAGIVAGADMQQHRRQQCGGSVVPERVVAAAMPKVGQHVRRHLAVTDQVPVPAQLEQRVEPGAVRGGRVEDMHRPERGPPPAGDRRQLVLGVEHQHRTGMRRAGSG